MHLRRIFPAVFMLPVLLSVAVQEGENVIANGHFDAEQSDFPDFWVADPPGNVRFDRAGGPQGQPCVTLFANRLEPQSVAVRQQGLVLVPGEPYRLSAWIRTRDFKCQRNGVVIYDTGWFKELSFRELPENSDWTHYEKTGNMFDAKEQVYHVTLFAKDLTGGEIGFADVRLDALSETARKGSRNCLAAYHEPRFVPMLPLLDRIPVHNPVVNGRWFGILDGNQADYDLVCTVAAAPPARVLPLPRNDIRLDFGGLAKGEYTLRVNAVKRADGTSHYQASFPIAIVDLPELDTASVKPLNNLVSELLVRELPRDPAPQAYDFVHPRDGWVFIRHLPRGQATGPVAISIAGLGTVIAPATPGGEAFRELARGTHTVTVEGNPHGGTLVICSIPEILVWAANTGSHVPQNGNYDWDYTEKHILRAVTTFNGGRMPGDTLAKARARGLKWFANLTVVDLSTPENMAERLENSRGLNAPEFDGTTCDELFFSNAMIDTYTKGLLQFAKVGSRAKQDRLIYSWTVGRPSIPSRHTAYISAALNASRGRGKMLYEAYCHTQATEAAAFAYLKDKLGGTMSAYETFFPGASRGSGMVFGSFNQVPIISLNHHPNVDFKYYMDMQLNYIANQPEFKGLPVTGYWGSYHGEDEFQRWAFLLMRHYAIDGRTGMLSPEYGFTYRVDFLKNCDFADGLDGWQVTPAGENAVCTETFPKYGKDSQGRWGATGGVGDTACVMTRLDNAPNRVAQTATGLTPGRHYNLQFVTADARDIRTKTHNPRRCAIDAVLGPEAEVLPEKTFVFVDRRAGPRERTSARVNLNYIVFKATAPTLSVVFTDENAATGAELALNYILLKPYLSE